MSYSGILLLGLAVADRFDAPVPLLGVVAEETLLVSNEQRLATVGRGVLPVLVDAVERTLQEEAAARPTDLLADLEREVCAKLVLLQKLRCAVGLRNLVHLLIYIRGGRERNGGQLVGALWWFCVAWWCRVWWAWLPRSHLQFQPRFSACCGNCPAPASTMI